MLQGVTSLQMKCTGQENMTTMVRSKGGNLPGCDITPNEVYKAGEHDTHS